MKFRLTLGLQKIGLPLIITSGKLGNLCFLIDTGASQNILFDFVYDHFRDEFKSLEITHKMIGIEGHVKENPIIEATFNFESINCTSQFTVLNANEAVAQIQKESGIQIHGILGTEFLIKNKWIIDFEKLEVRTNGEI